MNNPRTTISEWAKKINVAWRKSVSDFLDLAALCAQADKAVKKSGRDELIKKLCFHPTAFSKFVTIGNDSRLKGIRDQLPAKYSIIYSIAKLDDKKFRSAIEKGVINPRVQRSEIRALASPPAEAEKGDTPEPKITFESLKAQWEKSGLSRKNWEKASGKVRKSFIDEVLRAGQQDW